MENHHVSWVNQLFLWPFSIAMLNYERVHIAYSTIIVGYVMFPYPNLWRSDHPMVLYSKYLFRYPSIATTTVSPLMLISHTHIYIYTIYIYMIIYTIYILYIYYILYTIYILYIIYYIYTIYIYTIYIYMYYIYIYYILYIYNIYLYMYIYRENHPEA